MAHSEIEHTTQFIRKLVAEDLAEQENDQRSTASDQPGWNKQARNVGNQQNREVNLDGTNRPETQYIVSDIP